METVPNEVVDERDVTDEETAPGYAIHAGTDKDAHRREEDPLAIVDPNGRTNTNDRSKIIFFSNTYLVQRYGLLFVYFWKRFYLFPLADH